MVSDLVLITNLLNSYAYAVDTPDYNVLASCFTVDAIKEVSFPGVYDKYQEGYPSIEAHVRALHATFATHRHVITNHRFKTDGDTAVGQSVYTAYHWSEGRPTMKVGGVYLDKLVKHDGSWRIYHRRSLVDWREGAADQYSTMQGPR